MTEECLTEVNEQSSITITVSFTDEDGAPVTPDAATYRIDDKESRTEILDTTSFPSLSSSVDLEITSAQNAIIRERNQSEIRRVTVEYDYGSGKHGTAEYRYRVINLYGVTSP